MRRSLMGGYRIWYSICVATLLTFADVASAQNLLQNPGFEGREGFTLPEHSGRLTGDYQYDWRNIGEIATPTWWHAFWNDGLNPVHGVPYKRPEFKVMTSGKMDFGRPPHLIHEGKRACLLFGSFGAVDAGYSQQVKVTPGKRYRFSYHAYSWSTCGGRPVSRECPDGWPEDQSTHRAGIDPAGGTDFLADSVIWGPGVHFYDAYQQVPPVTVAARSDTITVFIRVTYRYMFLHNDSHVDTAELVEVEPAPPAIEVGDGLIARQVTAGGRLADDVLTIRNGGSGTMRYAVAANVPWLDVRPAHGESEGEADRVRLLYDVSKLPVGPHHGTIAVTSDNAGGSPQIVKVTVDIQRD